MKTRFLFPYWCKYLGVVLFLVHIPILIFRDHLGFSHDNTYSPDGVFSAQHAFFLVTALLMLTGMVLFAFSKEKVEDEQIAQLRMDSLQWAVYLSYLVLIILLAISPNRSHNEDLIHMNLWVTLLLFIVLFRWKMFRNSRYSKEDAI